MKKLSVPAVKVLNSLIFGLEVGESRKLARNEAFMPVHVERLDENLFSVAHYGEQNGDPMADPEMVFLRVGEYWLPVSMTQAYVGMYSEALILEGEKVTGVRQEVLADLCSFTTVWMRNIREQQGVKVSR